MVIGCLNIANGSSILKAAGKTVESVLYSEAPHAFYADDRLIYRPEVAKDVCTELAISDPESLSRIYKQKNEYGKRKQNCNKNGMKS